MKQLLFLTVVFSIFIISCNGQNKLGEQEKNASELKTKSIDTTQVDNQNFGAPFIDANYGEQISNVVRKIFQDSKGNMWFGAEGGAYRHNGKSLTHFEEIKNHEGQGVTIKDIVEDKNGNIWMGHTGGISKYDGKSITNYSEKDGLLNNDVWSLLIDRKGVLWIGTLQGACSFNENQFHPFPIPEGKPDRSRGVTSAKIIHSIIEDSKGQIWFSTNGGAYMYNGKSLSNISVKDGLTSNNVNSIFEDHQGNMWFATAHQGLCYFDGKSFTNISEKNELKGMDVWDIYQDKGDNIWFTPKGHGIYKYDGKSFTNFNEKKGLQSNIIMTIFQDKQGRVWFGGLHGVSRFENNSFINVTKNGPW